MVLVLLQFKKYDFWYRQNTFTPIQLILKLSLERKTHRLGIRYQFMLCYYVVTEYLQNICEIHWINKKYGDLQS